MNASNAPRLVLRALQVLLALATLGLSALVADFYMSTRDLASPNEVNFMIFLPIFTLLSVVYLETMPRLAPRAAHPIVSLVLELLNALFYMAGFIAMAVFISRLSVCNGALCAAGRAIPVGGAFSFCAWVATSVMMSLQVFKGGLRRTAPSRPPMMEA